MILDELVTSLQKSAKDEQLMISESGILRKLATSRHVSTSSSMVLVQIVPPNNRKVMSPNSSL